MNINCPSCLGRVDPFLELESAMNFSQALTYLSTDLNHHGQPHQWFHYVTVARPDGDSGAASATILSLAEAVAYGVPKGPVKIVTVSEGGTEAALEEAKKFLDDQHAGLIKHVAEPQPHG